MLNRHHKYFLIALMESFQHMRHLGSYKRKLKMHTTVTNSNGKIWFFVKEGLDVEVISYTKQQITVKISFLENRSK